MAFYYLEDKLRRDGNYCTPEGARVLQRTINAYWQRRGYMPNVVIIRETGSRGPEGEGMLVIRSDMTGGRPRGAAG